MKALLSCLTLLLCISGCASVPKGGSTLSAKTTDGIKIMQKENEKVISSLAEVERAILNESWENMYLAAERTYRRDNKIGKDAALNETQRIDVATLAAKSREDFLEMISIKEQYLFQQSRENTNRVLEMNDAVQKYLSSLEDYETATEKVFTLLKEMTPVDISWTREIPRLIRDAIKPAE